MFAAQVSALTWYAVLLWVYQCGIACSCECRVWRNEATAACSAHCQRENIVSVIGTQRVQLRVI